MADLNTGDKVSIGGKTYTIGGDVYKRQDYVFPKEGETKPSPKRSYSEYFEPFDWVVGTGTVSYTHL